MPAAFNAETIVENGWRQGAILGHNLSDEARKHAPNEIEFSDGDLIVAVSHDCDIANHDISKEPLVEVIRAH